ncbi:TonB-dependent receptor [Steroidobacter sp.]|uniref:TonB-dependent receptor n=1 Tax=Steroidobacter sp. TaxID=1978227 RepID=UPI001A3F66E2|nr:TonB-dependent receptor [Steroidobacter sp.]MBL8272098.1 TonB-dependent receptor [Steroidobacter sp.]
MIRKRTERRRFLAALLPLSLGIPAAMAQQGEQSAGVSSIGVEEVVVTARKRAESVREIPTSIDAFTGDRLAALGYSTVEDVLKLSPGVTFESGFSPSSTSVIMRGITNDSRGVGPRTVGRFYGNVPLTNPSIMGVEPDFDTFDMRSVEILKGPQGTLFGGSALAGAVRYEPNSPDFDRFHGAIAAGTGWTASSDDMSTEYALMLNAPLSDSFALRFAGSRREFAGYIDDAISGEKDINDFTAEQGRLMAAWKVTEDLTVQGQYLRYKGNLGAFNYVDGTEPVRVRTRRLLDDHEYSDVELYGAQISWDSGPVTTVLEGNRLKKDRDQLNDVTQFLGLVGTGITVGQTFLEATDQDTVELRIVSNAPSPGSGLFGGWQYTAGAFYMKSAQTRPVVLNLTFPTHRTRQGGGATVEAKEQALYFDLTRQLGSRFELNLGGRYFDQSTRGGNYRDFNYSSLNPGGLPAGVQFIPNYGSFVTLEETGFNPKAAVRWFANDNATLIASYAQGFRFGGINGFSLEPAIPVPFTFGSDEIDNYELGLRTTWLNRRLTADVTAFYIDWKNLQILQRASIYAYTDNVGAAEVKGVEMALNAVLTEQWSVLLNASYQNAETAVFFQSGEFGPIAAGTRLPQSPQWTGAAQVRHQRSLGTLDFDGSMTYSYRDDSTNNLINSVPLRGYGTLDAALSLQSRAMAMQPRLSLLGKNLTDENVALFGFTLGTVTDVISLNQPRQVMLKLDLTF